MANLDDSAAHAPFALSLEPDPFFSGAGRGEVLDDLFDAVDQGDPVSLVTGQNGSGKSALVSQLATRLEHVAQVLYLPQPNLPVLDLVRALSEQIGLDAGLLQSEEDAENALTACLQRRRTQGRRTVLVVEEAQSASSATLRSLHRMCQSGGTDSWLQLLVFADSDSAQTEALPRLLTPVSRHIELAAPSAEDVRRYCHQRLRAAGLDESVWMNDACAAELYRFGNGSFRRLNLLAGTAIQQAESNGDTALTVAHVRSAARQYGLMAASRPAFKLPRFDGISAESLRTLLTLKLPAKVTVPAACVASAILALLVVQPLSEQSSTSAADGVPVAALTDSVSLPQPITEARVLPDETVATVLPVVEERVESVETPVSNIEVLDVAEAAAAAEEVAKPVAVRRLGDPRLAVLGGAIAGLATRLSDAGDGPFALRVADAPVSTLTLIQPVDPETLELRAESSAPQVNSAIPQTTNPAETLDLWFEQSSDWLAAGQADRYSIQLLLVSRQSEKLREFLAQLPAEVDQGALRAFPTERDGRELMLVVFGNYDTADAARSAIQTLPRSLRRLQPFVRSLGSLRTAIQAV